MKDAGQETLERREDVAILGRWDNGIANFVCPKQRSQKFADALFSDRDAGQTVPRQITADVLRKVLRHRSPEADNCLNIKQFTKAGPRCQRGGVRGLANHNASPKQPTLPAKRCSNKAAAFRKQHAIRPSPCVVPGYTERHPQQSGCVPQNHRER